MKKQYIVIDSVQLLDRVWSQALSLYIEHVIRFQSLEWCAIISDCRVYGN